MSTYQRRTPHWTEPGPRAGCQARECPLGCWEVHGPAVYARAAAMAEAHAADYRARGQAARAERADQAATRLRAGAEQVA